MELIQTFDKPIHGYFDYGPKSTFTWTIQGRVHEDSKGQYIKVGSWSANHWFMVAVGKTEKQTLSNARRRLVASSKRIGIGCKFEYKKDQSHG